MNAILAVVGHFLVAAFELMFLNVSFISILHILCKTSHYSCH